jgi:hypothetical protein
MMIGSFSGERSRLFRSDKEDTKNLIFQWQLLHDHDGRVDRIEISEMFYDDFLTCHKAGVKAAGQRETCCGVRVRVLCNQPEGYRPGLGKTYIEGQAFRNYWIGKQFIRVIWNMLINRHPQDCDLSRNTDGESLDKWMGYMQIYTKVFFLKLGSDLEIWNDYLRRFTDYTKALYPEVKKHEIEPYTRMESAAVWGSCDDKIWSMIEMMVTLKKEDITDEPPEDFTGQCAWC